ncbi:ubiquinol oxidase subunit II [Spirabiliibacterium falconis]|uniref:ubiquinol oxidase subunit II n=1 Tax=Spirabiliibacterium falconis TaxID=572023 RepID=UPI001AAC6439|nr:ubiquinol oxidase subunit II [Spirabiliibacterium falconis]MBE2893942.1 ubiquinol oxidase subunit II [Spirabiliibacterium falconis]
MRKSKSVAWILGSFLLLLLAGCSGGILDPKGQVGMAERNLILTATGLMLIVVIPVIFMTFYFAWKYRHNRPDADKDYEPNWAHSNKIEFVMWTIPIIIIAILATITWKTTHELDPYRPLAPEEDTMTIEVVSMDWKWLFIYPEQNIAVVNEMALPVGKAVKFKITSNSVMNSFFIPQLGSQIYTMAAMQTQLHLIADHPGVYQGLSANYSGSGFSDMTFKVHADDQATFDAWVEKVRSSNTSLTLAEYKALSKPSKKNPVTYYSSVENGLFSYILNEFGGHFSHGGHAVEASGERHHHNHDDHQEHSHGAEHSHSATQQ